MPQVLCVCVCVHIHTFLIRHMMKCFKCLCAFQQSHTPWVILIHDYLLHWLKLTLWGTWQIIHDNYRSDYVCLQLFVHAVAPQHISDDSDTRKGFLGFLCIIDQVNIQVGDSSWVKDINFFIQDFYLYYYITHPIHNVT